MGIRASPLTGTDSTLCELLKSRTSKSSNMCVGVTAAVVWSVSVWGAPCWSGEAVCGLSVCEYATEAGALA